MIKTMFDDLNLFSAGDFATVNKQLYDNGVICPSGETTIATTALKVTNSSGNALIGNGSALIKGRVITVSGETVTLATNGTYKIVLEWSATSDGSQLKALSGSATLVQTDTQYQLLLATVVKSGTSLTVTDSRTFINKLSGNTALSIQTVPVTATPPTVGQALAYKDGQYVPTSIIDSGSNANGSWTKFSDGTMICRIRRGVTDQDINTPYVTNLFYGTRTWVFPVPFVSTGDLVVTMGESAWQGSVGYLAVCRTVTETQAEIRFFDVISRTKGTQAYTFSASATGRWK